MIYLYAFVTGSAITAGVISLASWAIYRALERHPELNDIEMSDD